MLDFLQKHFEWLIGGLVSSFGFLIVITVKGARYLTNLEKDVRSLKDNELVELSECDRLRESIKEQMQKEFDHGEKRFDKIEKMIEETNRKIELNHKMIMNRLLDMQK